MLEQLASNIGINNDEPNIKLAEKITKKGSPKEIAELINAIAEGKARIQSDCIKVLYEIGYRKPELLYNYTNDFIDYLKSKNNRLVWGASIALSTIAKEKADICFTRLSEIIKAYECGSVITIDNCISIFAGIGSNIKYKVQILPILISHFKKCRIKDIPQHIERVNEKIIVKNESELIKLIRSRILEANESQKKRIYKVID